MQVAEKWWRLLLIVEFPTILPSYKKKKKREPKDVNEAKMIIAFYEIKL